MSNRTLQILLGFAKSIKQDTSFMDLPHELGRKWAYNKALTDTVEFLERLIDNRVSQQELEIYLKEAAK